MTTTTAARTATVALRATEHGTTEMYVQVESAVFLPTVEFHTELISAPFVAGVLSALLDSPAAELVATTRSGWVVAY